MGDEKLSRDVTGPETTQGEEQNLLPHLDRQRFAVQVDSA
jgi:hypothetical protein